MNCAPILKPLPIDGDTPDDARQAIRKQGHIVVTNPDMLHAGILPHHTKWQKLFTNLKYVVIDELHVYRGVFGSHVTNVIRRLVRVCRFYGQDPVFICCSAIVANPREHAERVLERPVELIPESGAPSAAKTFILFNPPIVNRELGIRQSALTPARKLAADLIDNDIQTIVFTTSGLNVEVLTKYLKDQFIRGKPVDTKFVTGYRGGYLPNLRRQIFIQDFSEERAALSLLGEWVGNKGFLITFNGKSFDVGLLSTRFIMNRLHNPLNDMPHLDLLYPARRLIGHRLDNCRLMTLEERVLGFFRQGDVPGSEIPQRYFDWLRRRDARLVVDVFEHNRLDVISLASLMDTPHDLTQADHRDLLAAARLLIERGDALKARCLLEGLIGSGQEAAVKEGRKMLSLIHKRAGQ